MKKIKSIVLLVVCCSFASGIFGARRGGVDECAPVGLSSESVARCFVELKALLTKPEGVDLSVFEELVVFAQTFAAIAGVFDDHSRMHFAGEFIELLGLCERIQSAEKKPLVLQMIRLLNDMSPGGALCVGHKEQVYALLPKFGFILVAAADVARAATEGRPVVQVNLYDEKK